MHISDAVAAAIKSGQCIARRKWESPYRFRIEPTDTPDGCICHSKAMKNPCRGWQPTAEDLLADDWFLLSKYNGSEF